MGIITTYITFDSSKQACVKKSLPLIYFVTCHECQEAYEYFFSTFKNIGKTHLDLDIILYVRVCCQDRARYIQKAAFIIFGLKLRSINCYTHIVRKFNDSKFNGRISCTSNLKVIKKHIMSLHRCLSQGKLCIAMHIYLLICTHIYLLFLFSYVLLTCKALNHILERDSI